jgi:hypothetical protein
VAKGRCLYKLGRRRFANIEDKDDAVWIAVDNDGHWLVAGNVDKAETPSWTM